jgi:hypothetical protein
MKFIPKVVFLCFLVFPKMTIGQQFSESLLKLKDAKIKVKPTFFQIQKEFYEYWEPLNVTNGKYINSKSGKEVKAAGYKQFKRWEWYMKPRINSITGEFPTTSSQVAWNKYKALKKQQKKTSASSAVANWTNLGPDSSTENYASVGRMNCIAFHPTDTFTYWVGTPSGGLWKTTDDGATWTPLTDNITSLGVSNIIIPSDYVTSSTMYISTGDRNAFSTWSTGVLKSIDGGSTWNTTGLEFQTSQSILIYQLLLDPTDNNHIIATSNNGVYITFDAGQNWTLTAEESFVDLEAKPDDFNVLYGSTAFGDVYKSMDGGVSWVKTMDTDGLRTMIAVSANDVNRLYAIVANVYGGLDKIYKSTDAGETYNAVFERATENLLGKVDNDGYSGQAWYDLAIEASPTDANTLLVGGIITWRSTDAGLNWTMVNHTIGDHGAQEVHPDKHEIIYRSNGDLFEANDGGISISTDNGTTWTVKSNGIINSQMYKLGVSQTESGNIAAGLQDNGTKLYETGNWRNVHASDGMECIIDYENADIQYASAQNGTITRTLDRWATTGTNIGANIGDGNLRSTWVTTYIMDPKDHNTLYVAFRDVWKTTDQGNTFTKISTLSEFPYGNNVKEILAISPSDTNYLYVSDNRLSMVTKNGGTSWAEITHPTSLTNYGSTMITSFVVDESNPEKLWATLGDYDSSRVFESTDAGTTWTDISAGLPEIPVFCLVQVTLEGLNQLYVGTDLGVFVKDGNENWQLFNQGLPNVMVNELEIYYDKDNVNNSKLIAATYGRGLWETLIPINTPTTTYVPDDNFEQALISLGYDDTLDNFVLTSNLNSVTSLDISNQGIRDLQGIQSFISLTQLNAASNTLKRLDLSSNLELTLLNCTDNQLTSLDLSNNTSLSELYCGDNLLTTLNVNSNTSLTLLDCTNNSLDALYVKNGNNTNFTSFDTRNNSNLYCMEVDDDGFSNANWLNKDAQATYSLNCHFYYTFVPDDNFEQKLIDDGYDDVLDNYVLTANIDSLSSLDIGNLNITDLTGIEAFISLTDLFCDRNNIATINLSENTLLTSLKCSSNPLTSLNIRNNLSLDELLCTDTELTTIDLSQNIALTLLYILNSTKLTTLDVSQNIELTDLHISADLLTSIEFGQNDHLTDLYISADLLTSIEFGQNDHLTDLSISADLLTSIDLSQNDYLTDLSISADLLTSIDLSQNDYLTDLSISANLLTSIDLSQNSKLTDLAISNVYSVKTLDLSQNSKLTDLTISNSRLTTLNLKNGYNTLLTSFNYNYNSYLQCILVDDKAWSDANWANIADQTNFSDTGCHLTTWNGSESSAWNTEANWSNGIPNINSDVTIENTSTDPIITTAVSVKSVTINYKGQIRVLETGNLSTIGNFVNGGKAYFHPGSSLIVGGTSTGNIYYIRTIGSANWHLISSPVIGQDIDAFYSAGAIASGTDNNRGLSEYNNSIPGWTYYQDGTSGSGDFLSGEGRSIKLTAPNYIIFNGVIPTDNITVALTTNANGFNLLGNPYPSYIAVNSSADAEHNILKVNGIDTNFLSEATIWLWDQATSSYDAINQASSQFLIAPGQGFFVSANGDDNFSFTESMQSHQAIDGFQRTSATRPEITLFLTADSLTRETAIYYVEGTTTGFDNGYDSSIFSGGDTSFTIYSYLVSDSQGGEFQIQSLPDSGFETMIIPLGINAVAGSEINITANSVNFPPGFHSYLEDKEDNSFTLLEEDSSFTTALSNDLSGIGRFYLHTTTNTLSVNDVTLDHLSLYISKRNHLRIVGVKNGTTSARIFSILGKQVANILFEGNGVNDLTLPNLTSGFYIVQLTTQTGTLNKIINIKE